MLVVMQLAILLLDTGLLSSRDKLFGGLALTLGGLYERW